MSASPNPNPRAHHGFAQKLQQAWLKRGWIACLLLPFSWLYGATSGLRRLSYTFGLQKIRRVDAVVLVVGNVVAGGAGKTPTVISIVQHCQAAGWTVGVVSRGYGRQSSDIVEVTSAAAVKFVGDEPALIHRSTGTPVFVGDNRHEATLALLRAYPRTQIVICDDGLQHYAMHRDIDICVFDNRGVGNGWLLPSGPLRESWPRAPVLAAGQGNDSLLVLHTGNHPRFGGYRASRSLASFGRLSDGAVLNLAELGGSREKPLAAVAGIAQPQAFFDMLTVLNMPLARTFALPDHYDFDSGLRISHEGYRLICTEKDAQKVWKIAPDAIAVPLIQTAEPAFWQALDSKIKPLLEGKLSFPHGHQTT